MLERRAMTTMTESASVLPRLSVEPEEQEAVAAAPKRKSRALVVLPLLVALGLGVGGTTYVLGRGHESTNDAFVEGHVASVAPRVAGQVTSVRVADNQRVNAGDVLVTLDARVLVAKLDAARADLLATRASERAAETELAVTQKSTDSSLLIARGGLAQASAVQGATRASIAQAEADLVAAQSKRKLAQIELERTQALVDANTISQAELDVKRSSFETAEAAVNQALAALASAHSNVQNSRGTMDSARGRLIAAQAGPEQVAAASAAVELARARVAQAEAALEQAELNVSYTEVRAQVPGVVSRRSVEVGQLASPERPMMAIVPLDDTWVVANFKEDQIAHMQPGQPAEVSIDTYGESLSGHVDSLAGGTGSRFSLLPPDNASGNFTKVVQRVPVLIRLEPHPELTLRPGMSATATVDVR
jgi:membrane fusion protein (multidrug efflux system)